MKRLLYLLAIMALSNFYDVKAENVKVHAIVFCNTNDQKIGESCKNDQIRFIEQMGIIETALGCDVDWMNIYTGKECNKPNLESAMSNLKCNSNDVVFFYYSGHGVHAKADPADGWLPQMCLNYESYDQDKFVPVTYVRDKLALMNARLKIIITDCCNNEASWVTVKGLIASDESTPNVDDIDVGKLKKLFIDSRGTVIATSSKRGQMSLGPKEGGCFSMAFWDEIYQIEHGKGSPNWKSVMEETRKRTLSYTNNKQEPEFKADVNIDGYNSSLPPQTTPNPVIIAVGENELGEAFKQIVNPSYSRMERKNMVGGIVQRLFDPKAQVIMVGRNLTSKVGEPQNISDYLNELALSKTVRGINIIRANKSNSGKYDYIIVSEIR